MPRADIAVGVFTSALRLRERALSVQNTWLGDFPSAYLLGGSRKDPGLRMLSCGAKVGEDYDSALAKQFLGLDLLLDAFPAARWFFITGCDAYVYAENLERLLEGHDPSVECFVGGHCGRVEIEGEPLIFPSGGPGFALSRPLAERIRDEASGFADEWSRRKDGLAHACDAAMGYLVMRRLGVPLSYHEGFYHCQPYRYPGNPYTDGRGEVFDRAPIAAPIAFHSLSIREMYQLHRGRELIRPGLGARAFDYVSKKAAFALRTKRLINALCILLWGRA